MNKVQWRTRQRGRLDRPLVFEAHDGWFPLEKRLLLGFPSTRNWGEDDGWLFHEMWDYLAYLQSLTTAGRSQPVFYVNPANATRQVGLNSRGSGASGPKACGERMRSLLPRLESLGFIRCIGEYRRPEWKQALPMWEHQLMPTWRPDGLAPSGIPRTIANLDKRGRPYAMVPRRVVSTEAGQFARLGGHRVRRALMALYTFNDLALFGGADPNHLRIEESDGHAELCASDAFLAACDCNLVQLKQSLNELVLPTPQLPHPLVSLGEVYVKVEDAMQGPRLVYIRDVEAYDERLQASMAVLARRNPHLYGFKVRVFRPVHQTSYHVERFTRLMRGRVQSATS